MKRYLVLLKFTAKGAGSMPKSVRRAKAFAKSVKRDGVKVEAQFWCIGQYDGVLVLCGKAEKPLRVVARLAAQGDVVTETLSLLDADSFGALLR